MSSFILDLQFLNSLEVPQNSLKTEHSNSFPSDKAAYARLYAQTSNLCSRNLPHHCYNCPQEPALVTQGFQDSNIAKPQSQVTSQMSRMENNPSLAIIHNQLYLPGKLIWNLRSSTLLWAFKATY